MGADLYLSNFTAFLALANHSLFVVRAETTTG